MKKLIVLLFILSGCQSIQSITPDSAVVKPPVVVETIPESKDPGPRTSLHWEDTDAFHPERKAWSEFLLSQIDNNFSVFDGAQDSSFFCPKYKFLDKSKKLKAIGEILVAVTFYESGYNPKAASVDVGTKTDKNTWSVGLFQMSVVDQKNYGLKIRYTYDDLLTASPNIDLAIQILVKQLVKQNKYIVSKSVYWSTLSGIAGSKYSKIIDIANRVKLYVPECN